MRIAFIITRAGELGGAQVHVRDLAETLAAQGEEVSVLAGEGGVLFSQLDGSGVTCRLLTRLVHPIRPWHDLAALMEIRSVLTEIRPDLVTTHSNKAGLLGRLAAWSLHLKVIHTSHGFLFSDQPFSPQGCFYRLMEKIAARLGDKVIVVSESEYETAGRLKVIDPGRMAVIHNGLPDSDQSDPAAPQNEPLRIIMVARFAEPKDHYSLLHALSGIKSLSWELKLIGDGPGRCKAESLVKELGLEERVSFLGARENVPELLAGSQLFVLSSKREGFPISILEAMRAGLPVAASNVGGVSEAVIDGKTGLLFPAGDIDAMREKLKLLIADPKKRQVMGRAGRKRFLEKFTIGEMVRKTAALYAEVIAEENINGG